MLGWLALFCRSCIAAQAPVTGVERRREALHGRYLKSHGGARQKTEQPTQRRMKKAREEGNFPTARVFVSALQFLAFVALLHRGGNGLVAGSSAPAWPLLFQHALDPRLSLPKSLRSASIC